MSGPVDDAPADGSRDRARRLPYGARLTPILGRLRHAFRAVNAGLVPALDAGFGAVVSNPLTGYLLVLRTHGRRTGRVRQAPLGYVVLDGAIYCCAGFGDETDWYRNLVGDPRVEVVLPGRTLAASATPVTDPKEWVRAYRALIASLGLVARLTVGDISDLDDETLLAMHRAIPVVRIVPTGFVAGPLDPGGRFWLVPALASAASAALIIWRRGPSRIGRRRAAVAAA